MENLNKLNMNDTNAESTPNYNTEPLLGLGGVRCSHSFMHRLGNTMQGVVTILENLVMILTFSYYIPNWSMKFIMWRFNTKFCDKP